MGRRILAILVATVLAIVGAGLVFIYAQRADERAIADQRPETVYIVEAPVSAGVTLKEALETELIVQTQTAARAVPEGALQTVDETNSNLLATTDLPVGTYVLASSFGETPVGQKAIQVPDGQVAVSVSLSDPARVGSFVTPGSRIAIFASYTPTDPDQAPEQDGEDQTGGETPPNATSVLLDDVLVIAMGNTSLTPAQAPEGDEQAQQAASFLVTVALDPLNATRLVHGVNNFTLYAGLRGDDLEITPRNLTVDDLNVLAVPQQ